MQDHRQVAARAPPLEIATPQAQLAAAAARLAQSPPAELPRSDQPRRAASLPRLRCQTTVRWPPARRRWRSLRLKRSYQQPLHIPHSRRQPSCHTLTSRAVLHRCRGCDARPPLGGRACAAAGDRHASRAAPAAAAHLALSPPVELPRSDRPRRAAPLPRLRCKTTVRWPRVRRRWRSSRLKRRSGRRCTSRTVATSRAATL